jgi:hypothetical protein
VCPGPIHDLKKVGFDATADKARTPDRPATTLPGKNHIIVASTDDEGTRVRSLRPRRLVGRTTWGSRRVADTVARCGIKTNSTGREHRDLPGEVRLTDPGDDQVDQGWGQAAQAVTSR